MSDTAAAATQSTWTLDASHSNVEFSVRHLMISSVKGHFSEVEGTVTANDADPSGARVEVVVKTASIDTRQEQRDAHLRSADFFDADTFPQMRFVGTRVERTGSDTFKLTGDLTIKDVTRPLTLDVTEEGRGKDPWGGERAGFSATGKIKRSEFGLTWNQVLEAGGVAVGDDIKISADVELVKSAA
ncbi:MAG TPA: YceI family protein [Longimicrobiaceae bacterium]|jgi:polyisoprenoid-binding protein YceI|nr:YceI family protein [Longimicrobiaceae bacterium]